MRGEHVYTWYILCTCSLRVRLYIYCVYVKCEGCGVSLYILRINLTPGGSLCEDGSGKIDITDRGAVLVYGAN